MKHIIFVVALSAMITLSACSSHSTLTSESLFENELTEKTLETNASSTETAIYSDDTKDFAKTFAKALYAELKNTEGEYPFSPISCEHVIPESGFDPEAFEADIFFLDTNSDGSPELFAGGHGTAGLGRYSVFSSCGKKLGNEIFCCFPDMYCIADNVMYAPSNTNWRTGWVKFCAGLPNVCINYVYDDADSEVKIENAEMEINGEKQVLDSPSLEEAENAFSKFLDTDYSKLASVPEGEEPPFVYARGYLRVPDPENYTEEDIYNCLTELLSEYEKISMLQEE